MEHIRYFNQWDVVRKQLIELTLGLFFFIACYLSIFSPQFGTALNLDFYFGYAWQRRYIFFFGYWALVSAYVFFIEPRPSTLKFKLSQILKVGSICQLYLLLAHFLGANTETTLPAKMFQIYARFTASSLLCFLTVHSFFNTRQIFRKGTLSSKSIFVFLPVTLLIALSLKLSISIICIGLLIECLWSPFQNATLIKGLKRNLDSFPRILFIVFLLALAMRIPAAWRLSQMDWATVLANSDDAQGYYSLSSALLRGEYIAKNYSIGYAGLVALMRMLTHQNNQMLLLLQAFILSLSPVAICIATKKLFDQTTALIAGILCALCQLLIFNSVNLTREAGANLLLPWILVLFLSLYEEFSSFRQFVTSLLIAVMVGILVTIDNVYLPIFSILFASLFFLKKWPLSRRILIPIISLGVIVMTVHGLGILICGKGGLLTRSSNYAGLVFAYANKPAELLAIRGINPFNPTEFIPNILKNPQDNLYLLFLKVWVAFQNYFFESYSGAFDPLVLVRNSVLAGTANIYIYAAGVLGVILAPFHFLRSKAKRRGFVLLVITGLFISTYIVFFMGSTRHRASMQSLLEIFLAFGVVSIFRWIQEQSKLATPTH